MISWDARFCILALISIAETNVTENDSVIYDGGIDEHMF